MQLIKKLLFIFIASPSVISVHAQFIDTTVRQNLLPNAPVRAEKWNETTEKRTGAYRSFIAPGILVVYGIASLKSNQLQSFNNTVKEEIWQEHTHKRTCIDDYLRFAPAVAVYGLNAMGIKGRNSFRDRSMIYLLSNAVVTGAVFGIKSFSNELRPDGSDYYSFPSGHTAAAFASAEFMRMEYKDVSPWYGVAGYVAAGATGALRMYNNRHWMSDVLAGAGIGIASTKLAYLIYPAIKKKLFKDKPMNTMIMPYYQNKSAGLAMVYHFH
ncbi:MAG: phosphatase PAP2 family protein [Ferruginibacter sp.]